MAESKGDIAEAVRRLGWSEEGGQRAGTWVLRDAAGRRLASLSCRTTFTVVGSDAALAVDGSLRDSIVRFKFSNLMAIAFPHEAKGWRPYGATSDGMWYPFDGYPGLFAQYRRPWEYEPPAFDGPKTSPEQPGTRPLRSRTMRGYHAAVVHAYETWTYDQYGISFPTFDEARRRALYIVASKRRREVAR